MELISTFSGQVLIGIWTFINIVSLFVMANDKRKSTQGRNSRRSPEGFIFFLATALGGIGVYLGMQLFRHKTQKLYFQLGIPLLILQNLATIYLVWKMVI